MFKGIDYTFTLDIVRLIHYRTSDAVTDRHERSCGKCSQEKVPYIPCGCSKVVDINYQYPEKLPVSIGCPKAQLFFPVKKKQGEVQNGLDQI